MKNPCRAGYAGYSNNRCARDGQTDRQTEAKTRRSCGSPTLQIDERILVAVAVVQLA